MHGTGSLTEPDPPFATLREGGSGSARLWPRYWLVAGHDLGQSTVFVWSV